MEDSNDVVHLALQRMKAGAALKERRIRRIGLFCITGILSAAVWFLFPADYDQHEYKLRSVKPPEIFALDDGRIGVRLKEDRQGHFYVVGTVNGHEVLFLIDTGATGVHLPEKLARKIGLQEHARSWSHTANGRAPVFLTSINHLGVGGLSSRNVSASYGPGMDSGFALLGMTFLRNFEMRTLDGALELIEKI